LVCDEHGIAGGGEYCGGNDAQLDCIIVSYDEALGGWYVSSAVFRPRARRDRRFSP
jgi:hypothetical protein